MTLESPVVELPPVSETDSPGEAAVGRLVVRARSGDGRAFEELVGRFGRSVHAVALSRVRPEEAEDVVQETFTLAWRRLGDLREAESFGAWIHSVARNLATDHLRARLRRPRTVPLADVAAARASGDDELRKRVLEHLQNLPEAYRETLAMRLVEGMTGPEIAEATGLAAGSVRVNLCRGMDMLRELLKKEGWA